MMLFEQTPSLSVSASSLVSAELEIPVFVLVHASESASSRVGLLPREGGSQFERGDISPEQAALYCLLFAETHFSLPLSMHELTELLIRFYDYEPVVLDEYEACLDKSLNVSDGKRLIEVDMYQAREEGCAHLQALLNTPFLYRESLYSAVFALSNTRLEII
ncbi:hypothetical protein TUM4438_10760 [Shewanella sairae]|uniref:Uncharacterized protein n=1 Tax=Shewanella sairae TaxID=190310 RepID=A0ABQ4P666_9GAMM|nr:hypothetical protein [Shewanella sairae]MCL1130509.1 hypothetical protein [Shewanella sairae]GIU42959.1 hypothetical protein TUM4438_10760 [Shewanella sairae]